MIFGIDPDAAEAYLGSEVRSLGAHLLAWRGRYEEATRIATLAAGTSARMGDIQAVLPPLAALASAQAGLGEDAAAVASIDRGIELRGTSEEAMISAWYLFEAADTLSVIAARDPSSAAVRAGLDSVAAYARALGPEAARPGDLVLMAVGQVLFGAAVDQLARLSAAVGVTIERPAESFPDTNEALLLLDREHRIFDVARILLWKAEAGESVPDLEKAAATLEELGAHQYLERVRKLMA